MLSLERCRSLIGPNGDLSDATLKQLRDDLYVLANAALESFRHRERGEQRTTVPTQPSSLAASPFPMVISLVPDADRHPLEERAAIFEFEAGQNRHDADREALLEWSGRSAPGKDCQLPETLKKNPNNSCEPR